MTTTLDTIDSCLAPLAERVGQIEARLERLMAGGVAALAAESTWLEAEADALAQLGLPALAERLRAVTATRDTLSVLGAVTVAVRACHLARLRLSTDTTTDETQPAPLVGPGGGRKALQAAEGPDRLLLLSRMLLDGAPAWTALALPRGRSRGHPALSRAERAYSLVLLEPVNVPPGVAPWLGDGHLLTGDLQWVERQPLGASDTLIDRYSVAQPAWEAIRGTDADPLRGFRTRLAKGGVPENAMAQSVISSLTLRRLSAKERELWHWLDPSHETSFSGPNVRAPNMWAPWTFLRGPKGDVRNLWVLCWSQGTGHVPLARFVPDRDGRTFWSLMHPADGTRDPFRLS